MGWADVETVRELSTGAEPFTLQLAGLTHALTVRSFRGREGLSTPTVFDLDVLTSRKVTAAQGSLLGRAAALVLRGHGETRRVHGVVTAQRVEGHPARDDLRQVRVRLASRLWLLSQRRGSRIHQGMSAVAIAATVLRGVGVAVEARLDARPHVLDYCVQYRETELEFVTRILAEHGVAFALRPADDEAASDDDAATRVELADVTLFGGDDASPAHRIGGERAVLFDHPGAWRDAAIALPFARAVDDRAGLAAAMTEFAQRARVRPTAVSTRSYDPRQPAAELATHASTRRPEGAAPSAVDALGLADYDHRDEYLEPLPERFRARMTLDALRRGAEACEGRSTSRDVTPGARVVLDGHREAAFNREYLVTAVRHEGRVSALSDGDARDEVAYANRLRCVASDVMPRPRRAARPVAQVVETAVVVGPEEGVCADPAGRVRVRFHWDRRGAASDSAWLRVAQQWSGAHHGAQFIPRVGTEVLVTFLDGDPDRPVITGALHHGAHPMPFDPVAERSRSGWRSQTVGGHGHHELSFDDTAGAEELRVRAQRDLTERVLRDRVADVGRDARTTVAHDQHVTVRGDDHREVGQDARSDVGRDARTTVRGSLHETVVDEVHRHVGASAHLRVNGAEQTRVQGDAQRTVHGDEVTQVGTHDAPRAWTVHADDRATVHATRDLTLSADASITLRVGHSVIRVTPERIEMASPELRLTGDHARLTLAEGRASLHVEEQVTVRGQRVLLRGEGAGVGLSTEAAVDGARVLLNSAQGPGDRVRDPHGEPTRLRLVDDAGRPMAGRPFVMRTRDGQEYLGITGRDGRAEIDVPDGGTVRFLDLPEVE